MTNTYDTLDYLILPLLFIALLYGFSYCIMYTYNNSIPNMNSAMNQIDLNTAIMFSLFIMFVRKLLFFFREQI